jgi:cell division transport system permease protein
MRSKDFKTPYAPFSYKHITKKRYPVGYVSMVHNDNDIFLIARPEKALIDYVNIRAKDSTQYGQIAEYLSSDTSLDNNQASIIEKVNYYQNQEIIDRMTAVTRSIDTMARIVMLIFVALSIIVIYNTIRLAIYASREEIHVMRLVGAQKRYVHGPFMVEGLLTGVFGAIITAILWYPVTLLISKKMTNFFQGFSFLKYYTENFIQIFIIMLVAGVIIGMISAALCVNKFINAGQE